jgi:hypothetical protein
MLPRTAILRVYRQIKLMALDDEDLKPLWEGEAK